MSDVKNIPLTVNGVQVEVPPGTTVFQAAQKAGVFIPHYCYHPDLSIAGVCRMCMVEIEKAPKLQISCNTPVAPGMVVKANTEKVAEAVKGILELHLINHPLDCPICDKAGECKLQDFYQEYGLYESRMDYEKVHKPKVVDIGTIVLDSERCILCTRCVRFTAEVSKTNELGIFNRGDRSELRTWNHGPLHNDYTGNLADICPVGALTAKDFRFQQRVWFLEKTESVCHLCAHGCSTQVSINPDTNKLYRVEPRRNPDVNRSWICDTGRWDYHYSGGEGRLGVPKKRDDGHFREATWNEFFQDITTVLEKESASVAVALSAQLTNEEIVDAIETFKKFGVQNFSIVVDEMAMQDRKPFDGVLRHKDETPNALGAEKLFQKLGVKNQSLSKAKHLFVLGVEGSKMPGLAELLLKAPQGTNIYLHASNPHTFFEKCAWVLPNVTAYEKSGSFVSALSRLQKLNAAIPPKGTARNVHALCLGLREGKDRATVSKKVVSEFFTKVSALLGSSHTDWKTFPSLGAAL